MKHGWKSAPCQVGWNVTAGRFAVLLLAGLILLPAGCRGLGTYRPPAWLGTFRTARSSTTTPAAAPKPLSVEQKADVQFALGRNAEARGEIDEAIEAYRQAMAKDSHRGDVCHRLAVLHERKGDLAKADEYYAQALERSPEDPEIRCDWGYSLYLRGKLPEAEAQYAAALQLRSDFPRAHINYGLLLARTGRDDGALNEFFLAGISEPQARLNLAFAMLMENRSADASAQIKLARHLTRDVEATRRIEHLERLVTATSQPAPLDPPEMLTRLPEPIVR